MANGAQLAVDQINANGGLGGVMLTLIRLDDRATAAGGLSAAHKAIAAHAFAVMGPFNSSVGVANLPVYQRAGLPIVRLTSSVKIQGFGVTTQPMDSQVAPVEIHEITKVLRASRPAVIYDTSTYTAGIASTYTAGIASQVKVGLAKAGDPVVAYVSVKTGQASFRAALHKVGSSHPGLLYISAYGTDAGMIAKEASSMGNVGRCFVGPCRARNGLRRRCDTGASACLSSGEPSARQFAGAAQYVSAYQTEFHTSTGTWARTRITRSKCSRTR